MTRVDFLYYFNENRCKGKNSYGPEIIFSYQGPVTLTFDLFDPKSIWVQVDGHGDSSYPT